jgi:hypothetical protein
MQTNVCLSFETIRNPWDFSIGSLEFLGTTQSLIYRVIQYQENMVTHHV